MILKYEEEADFINPEKQIKYFWFSGIFRGSIVGYILTVGEEEFRSFESMKFEISLRKVHYHDYATYYYLDNINLEIWSDISQIRFHNKVISYIYKDENSDVAPF